MAAAWIFRYVNEPASGGQHAPLRPVVPVRLRGEFPTTRVAALVDSGSERTLAAPALARAAGVRLSEGGTRLAIGGRHREIRFANVGIDLFSDLLENEDEPLESWHAEVGFFSDWEPPWAVVLGQRGFFDTHTVTMNRSVPALAVEPAGCFSDRFAGEMGRVRQHQPRFRP